MGAPYKHAGARDLKFGRTADSRLLAKGYDEGGPVTDDSASATLDPAPSTDGGDAAAGQIGVGPGARIYSPQPQAGSCPPGRVKNSVGDCITLPQTN
jgi:hypothetical protein